jgi:hypothetical protein
MEAITNTNLKMLAERFKIKLIDVVSKDHLPFLKPKNGSYIINLQDSDAGQGSHWVCMFINDKRGVYYDSFGKVPPNDVLTFLKKNGIKNVVYNADRIQDLKSDACGYYCLMVLQFFTMHRKASNYGYALNLINKPFDTLRVEKNEAILKDYFHKSNLDINLETN